MTGLRQLLNNESRHPGTDSDAWLLTYRIDLDGEPTLGHISPTVEQTLGYRPSELVGRQDFSFIHPDERQRFNRFLADPPRESAGVCFRLQGADGRSCRGRHVIQPFDSRDGELGGLECVVYDRPATWELPFDSIVDAIGEGVLILRFGGEIVYVNHRMAQMLGYRFYRTNLSMCITASLTSDKILKTYHQRVFLI